MKKILITGGAGYIGSHVLKQLLQQTEYEIMVLDNFVTGFKRTLETLQEIRAFRYVNQDLSSWEEVDKLIEKEKFHVIMHFAASLVVPESIENPIKYYLNNSANTTHLVHCAVKHKVQSFIFSSTAAVYGEVNLEDAREGITEAFIKHPMNPYGESKLFSERVIEDVANVSELKYIIFRYFNVVGVDKENMIGQYTKNATHLFKVIAETALGKRDKVEIFGNDYETRDGTCIRDYIDIDDLVNAHIQAILYLEENDSDIFNIGYGKGYSVQEVIDMMKKVSGVDFKVITSKRREGDPPFVIANNQKILTKMRWKPQYDSLELICQKIIEWEKKL